MHHRVKHIGLVVFLFLILSSSLRAGVLKGSTIATPVGLKTVESLKEGDEVYSFNVETQLPSQVCIVGIQKRTSPSVIIVFTEKTVFLAAPDQKIFDPVKGEWIAAASLTDNHVLVDRTNSHIKCRGVFPYNSKDGLFTVYNISTAAPHTFYSSDAQILTHNFLPITLGISFIFDELISSLAFGGISFAIGAIAGGINKNKEPFVTVDPLMGENLFGQRATENDLRRKDKKDHILQGKHNWHKLDPDPQNNWDNIIKIILLTLQTGNHTQDNPASPIFTAIATINNQVVGVRYAIVAGLKRVSTAWVQ